MPQNKQDKRYKGKKYSLLTLLSYSSPGRPGWGTLWNARCDCGTDVVVRAKEVVNGNIRSCGKCELGRKLTKERKAQTRVRLGVYSRLYNRDLMEALRRGIKWELSEAVHTELIGRNCLYCGCNPCAYVARSRLKRSLLTLLDGNSHYHATNVAPICPTCDRWKNTSDSESFIDRILALADRIRRISASQPNK